MPPRTERDAFDPGLLTPCDALPLKGIADNSHQIKNNRRSRARADRHTSNHRFWSVDRQEFVQAGSVEIGERLQTLRGDVKVVQQKLPRPGPQPVFNLEVHNEHVYFVGEDGVLVHNNGPRYRQGSPTPSDKPDPIATPSGHRKTINDADDFSTRRSLTRENETADAFAQSGYRTTQEPPVPYDRDPDLDIEGYIYDVYAPAYRTPMKNIFGTVLEKVYEKGQANRVIINLTDSKVSRVDLIKHFRAAKNHPKIEEVLAVGKNGNISTIYKKGR